jgi:hypothetical protein
MQSSVTSDSPIFIVGCQRSGTTLLRNLLRSHPHLAFPEESYFIPAYYKGYGDPRSAREARRLAATILRLYWVRHWGMPLRPEDFSDCRTFREVVCRLFETWARQQGKRRWGDKTPHYVAQIPVLLELFPAAKILHIIRDGRDVALSWLKTRFDPLNLYTAASMWNTMVRAGRQAGAGLPQQTYMEVRYETLLAETQPTMREVCAFLDEPFHEAVLKPTLGALVFPALQRGGPALSTEIVSSNTGGWKRQMGVPDRILFESVAGDLLEELGYETEGRRRRISLAERTMWELHHRVLWVRCRLKPQLLRAKLSTYLRIKLAGHFTGRT